VESPENEGAALIRSVDWSEARREGGLAAAKVEGVDLVNVGDILRGGDVHEGEADRPEPTVVNWVGAETGARSTSYIPEAQAWPSRSLPQPEAGAQETRLPLAEQGLWSTAEPMPVNAGAVHKAVCRGPGR